MPARRLLLVLAVAALAGPVAWSAGAPAAVPRPARSAWSSPRSPSSPSSPSSLSSPAGPSPAPVGVYRVGVYRVGVYRVGVYRAPVLPLRVLRGFTPPATRYGPGHLGVDLGTAAGGVVRAAGAGTVTFAGSVAGRGLVVVQHPDGIRTEYEPLHPLVTRGQQVEAGAVLGTVSGAHRGCPGPCVHWGARRGETYLDPLSLLRPLGAVRLLPWSG